MMEKHLETLINLKKQRLRLLEKKEAKEGLIVDPSVLIEIEYLQEDITTLRQQLRQAQATVVKLFTRPGARPATDHYLDWSDYYEQAERPRDIWQTTWLPDMARIRDRHSADAVLLLSPKAHLSAGIAFGYTFPTTMGIPIWVEQYSNGQADPAIWRSNLAYADDKPTWNVQHMIVGPDTGDLLLELSISQTTQGAVDQWLAHRQTMFYQHIRIEPWNGAHDRAIEANEWAVHLAHSIRKQIVMLRGTHPHMTTHIVGAFPIGLAVFLGMHLNACGNIQCYEYDRPQQTYTPTCLLTPQ